MLIVASVQAQSGNFRVLPQDGNGPATMNADVGAAPRAYPAGLLSVPSGYPYYPNYLGPAGGYLSGASDVIGSQGQFLIDLEQRKLLGEDVKRSKLDTRRKTLDEYLYERANTPTTEDERERLRIESIRRSRNDPPPHEIWSGRALNELLLAIQQMQIQNGPGRTVLLNPDVVSRINVTSGNGTGQTGLLREGGKLKWPMVLKKPIFAEERKKLDELMPQAVQEAQSGSINDDVVQGMKDAVAGLDERVKRSIEEITATEYSQAKRFIRELSSTVKALQDPNVANYLGGKWVARANTVADLVDQMTRQGLKFAPAVTGEEAAYTALHTAMVAYYVPPNPSRPWDPAAK
jgi:hypothetical protein